MAAASPSVRPLPPFSVASMPTSAPPDVAVHGSGHAGAACGGKIGCIYGAAATGSASV